MNMSVKSIATLRSGEKLIETRSPEEIAGFTGFESLVAKFCESTSLSEKFIPSTMERFFKNGQLLCSHRYRKQACLQVCWRFRIAKRYENQNIFVSFLFSVFSDIFLRMITWTPTLDGSRQVCQNLDSSHDALKIRKLILKPKFMSIFKAI